MLLRKISLNNIRSYENLEIEFPSGSTLLWGDIGSGKTSILLGIEFALFGLQPGQKGSMLLRNGTDYGGVKIEFEVEGKNIIIERSMKRSKTISQDFCSINIDGEEKEISVTELKDLVLDLLSYPKEFSKKQNLLYKFTVYTPQEEMKQIILQDSNTRLNTLRHVFGVDKYKKILENISIITAKIREEKRLKEGMTSNLEQDKQDLEKKQIQLESKKTELISLESDMLLKIKTRKSIELEKQSVEGKILEKNKLEQEIEKTKILISTKLQSELENQKNIKQLQEEIQSFYGIEFEDSKITMFERQISDLNKQKIELNEKNLQITSQINSLMMKTQDNEDLKKKLSKLEMCPTCLQDVGPVHKSNVANKLDSESSENANKIKSMTLDKQDIIKKINLLEQEILSSQKQINELNILKIRLQTIQEKRKRLEDLEKQNLSIKKDTELLNNQVELLKSSVFELSKYKSVFDLKQKEFLEAQKQEKLAEIKVAELKREISVFSSQIEETRKRIEKTQAVLSQLIYLSELENWINKKFTPIISHIEKNVMVKLKLEFSKFFSEWFSMLVPGDFHVRLSDDFTPIIEQQDYEIDYSYLSGGERTAIALAYRLALNQVINSLLSKIKTKDLVILDEPTDGFSEQQLDKMRDVLQQLNVAQLIIVSHEQKIESFVENVIKFRKQNGISLKD